MGGGELSIEERSVQALALAKALAGALSIEEKNALVERVTAQFICQDRMKLWDHGPILNAMLGEFCTWAKAATTSYIAEHEDALCKRLHACVDAELDALFTKWVKEVIKSK